MSQPTGVLRVAAKLVADGEGAAEPKPIESRITTRGYELDHDSLVPPHVLLRYMEHLRWLVHAEREGSAHRLFEDGNHAVLVAEKLVIHEQLGFDVELTGTTAVARVGRTSIEFFHGLYRGEERRLVAAGRVTAVHVGPSRKPEPLPEGLRNVTPVPLPPAVTFPTALDAAPPADAWQLALRIRPSDQDLLGHANHAKHLALVDDTRREAAAAGAFAELSRAAAGRLKAAAVDFKQQTVAGDELLARTWVINDAPLEIGVTLVRAADQTLVSTGRLHL